MTLLPRRAVGIALAAAAASALDVHAYRLPDWARRIAEHAPALEAAPDDRERVLLSETLLSIESDGKLRIRRRLAVQALVADAEEVGVGVFHFDESARMRSAKAWHLAPGERVDASSGAGIDVTLDSSFLTDSRSRLIGVDGVRRGSLVFFEFDVVETPMWLAYLHAFREAGPVDSARVEVAAPPGWQVRHAWLRRTGPEPTRDGPSIRFELHDLPAVADAPLAEPPGSSEPLLLLCFVPPEGAKTVAPSLPDFATFGTWYETLLAGRDAPSPELRAVASEALKVAGQDPVGRILAVARVARDGIRYVAKEIGSGTLQPRPASLVATERWGDCKDKGTYLSALLALDGRASFPMLVHASLPETVSDAFPAPGSFNHFVVGVPIPPDAVVPEPVRGAVIDAGELGRLLVVDATDEYTAPGQLRPELLGKRALVVAGARSRLVVLPGDGPSRHRIEHRLEEGVDADGALVATLTTLLVGEPATLARLEQHRSAHERRLAAEREITRRWERAAVTGYEVEPETADGAFRETISWRIAAPGSAAEGSFLALFPGALDGLDRTSVARRTAPVVYPHPLTLRYESRVRGGTGSGGIPQGFSQRGEGWSIDSTHEFENGLLVSKWALDLDRTRFEPGSFPELKRLWSAASASAGHAIVWPKEQGIGP